MFKKIIIIIFITFTIFILGYAQETKTSTVDKNIITQQDDGFIVYFNHYVGKHVLVAINGSDLTIEGTLKEVYKDGIVIINLLKQTYYVPRNAISYAKVN